MRGSRNDVGLSERLVHALVADYPDHEPGTRPVHAVGIGARGYFVASGVARTYSRAEHLQGDRIPVTVRFSNGTGSSSEDDDALDVRGMAAKFHLPSGAETDLIMITLPVFFASTPQQFLEFAVAGIPEPIAPTPWWRPLLDKLQLRQPPPPPDPDDPGSGTAGVVAFANRNHSARAGTVAAFMLVTPTSYARVAYHALHTFVLTGPDDVVCYARVSWEPVAGVRPEKRRAPAPDYLRTELGARLRHKPARFVLRMVLAGQGDAIDDPTIMWDTTRPRIVMGELVLTDVMDDSDELAFNPTRVVPGFECSDDKILEARRDAYEYSYRLRREAGCPVAGGAP